MEAVSKMADKEEQNKIEDEKTDETPVYGCDHYKRKCLFVSPCCKKVYPCRICHNDVENHEIDRKAVMQIKCAVCELVQKVQQNCEGCGILFGKYYCEKCRLFDDEEKGQFHCDGCGLCRIGGKEKFFHCEKCDMCLSVKLIGKHICVEESSRRNCAVCLEDLHTSRSDAHIPPCGHLIHRDCLKQCFETGNYCCPTCAQSLVDMSDAWQKLDFEVSKTQMPEEYKNFYVSVLCRDCHKDSRVLFHVIGLKCQECGSYNTCRTADRETAAGDPGTTMSSAETGSLQGAEGPSPRALNPEGPNTDISQNTLNSQSASSRGSNISSNSTQTNGQNENL